MALTSSLPQHHSAGKGERTCSGPSSQRQCIHILYMLHDVLHDLQRHQSAAQNALELAQTVQPCLKALVRLASAADYSSDVHTSKLFELFALWRVEQYLEPNALLELQEIAQHSENAVRVIDNAQAESDTDPSPTTPLLMPASHGDAFMPFHDLPAATMIPYIIPNSAQPLDPHLIKPLHLVPGLATKAMSQHLRDLLAEGERMYSADSPSTTRVNSDIDPLGQFVEVDRTEVLESKVDSYYGWSRQFCQMMKVNSSIDRIMNGEGDEGSSPSISGIKNQSPSAPGSQTGRSTRSYSPPSPSRPSPSMLPDPQPSPPLDPRKRKPISR